MFFPVKFSHFFNIRCSCNRCNSELLVSEREFLKFQPGYSYKVYYSYHKKSVKFIRSLSLNGKTGHETTKTALAVFNANNISARSCFRLIRLYARLQAGYKLNTIKTANTFES